jgi:hypothetical protein
MVPPEQQIYSRSPKGMFMCATARGIRGLIQGFGSCVDRVTADVRGTVRTFLGPRPSADGCANASAKPNASARPDYLIASGASITFCCEGAPSDLPSMYANRLLLIVLTARTARRDPKRRTELGGDGRVQPRHFLPPNRRNKTPTNAFDFGRSEAGSDALIAGRQPPSAPKRYLDSTKNPHCFALASAATSN